MLRKLQMKRTTDLLNKIDTIEKLIDKSVKQKEFDKRMIELGELRKKVIKSKSLITLTEVISKSPDLKYRKFLSAKIREKNDAKHQFVLMRNRVFQVIDGLISTEVMKYYKIPRK